MDPHAGLAFTDPGACESCHADQVAQWGKSMHAHAHHTLDPIYGKMRDLRIAKQGEETGAKCLTCHRADPPGVTCETCHSEVALLAPQVADGKTVCLTCHEASMTPSGAPACTTGPESRELADAGSCTSCHMPDGSHEFVGPHHAWNHDDPSFLKTAVDLDLALEGGKAVAVLKNKTGHAFPTGFPGRVAVLEITTKDSKGVSRGEPKQFLLNKVYVDADGKPVPAAFAAELKSDSRLTPGEARTFEVEVDGTIHSVDARLIFRLLPPPLAEKLDLSDTREAEPRVILTATAQ